MRSSACSARVSFAAFSSRARARISARSATRTSADSASRSFARSALSSFFLALRASADSLASRPAWTASAMASLIAARSSAVGLAARIRSVRAWISSSVLARSSPVTVQGVVGWAATAGPVAATPPTNTPAVRAAAARRLHVRKCICEVLLVRKGFGRERRPVADPPSGRARAWINQPGRSKVGSERPQADLRPWRQVAQRGPRRRSGAGIGVNEVPVRSGCRILTRRRGTPPPGLRTATGPPHVRKAPRKAGPCSAQGLLRSGLDDADQVALGVGEEAAAAPPP